jgi:hypothetical protein
MRKQNLHVPCSTVRLAVCEGVGRAISGNQVSVFAACLAASKNPLSRWYSAMIHATKASLYCGDENLGRWKNCRLLSVLKTLRTH